MYLINTSLCKSLLSAEGLEEGKAAVCCISEWGNNSLRRKAVLILLVWEGEAWGTKPCWVFICKELFPDGVFVLKMPRS